MAVYSFGIGMMRVYIFKLLTLNMQLVMLGSV
jgi:hypothetical protein